VIGCSIAWRLAQLGLKVAVFERGRVGCEASRAAAGMLSPQGEAQGPGPFFDLCLRSRAMYRSFAAELTEASGIDVEYRDDGTLFVLVEGEDEAATKRWTTWQLKAGLPLEHVSADDLRKLEPGVTELASRAIFLPEEHQIENRRLMDALEVAIRKAGGEIIEGAEVWALTTERDRVTGVMSAGKRVDAGVVIVAAGTWSSHLLNPLGLNVQLIPVRGQMVAVRSDSTPIKRIIHSSDVYLVPRRDGRVLLGATVEYVGFQKAVTVTGLNQLLSAAIELAPSLSGFDIVESWSGLRPDTVDHFPIIGPGCIENLFLATGHFRNGILLAPITAQLIVQLIIDECVPNQLKPFSIDRFRPSQPEMSR